MSKPIRSLFFVPSGDTADRRSEIERSVADAREGVHDGEASIQQHTCFRVMDVTVLPVAAVMFARPRV
jgi:hypothetical protein